MWQMTRATPRCCEASIDLPKVREELAEKQAEVERLMRDNKSLRSSLEKSRALTA